jgi:hypothetical protein
MLRSAGTRRAVPAVLVPVAVAVLVAVLASGGVAAAKPAQSTKTTKTLSASKLVQVGHGTFWECKAKTTQILVGVNTLTLHPGSTLNIDFVVRNEAAAECNYVAPYTSQAPGPTSTALQAGPCGSIGYEIVGAHRKNVWPGPQAFNCPALGFAQLQPSATVSGSGSWNQDKPGGSGRVPAGSYTLVVDGHFDFPLHVDSR